MGGGDLLSLLNRGHPLDALCPLAVMKLWGKGDIAAGSKITPLNWHGERRSISCTSIPSGHIPAWTAATHMLQMAILRNIGEQLRFSHFPVYFTICVVIIRWEGMSWKVFKRCNMSGSQWRGKEEEIHTPFCSGKETIPSQLAKVGKWLSALVWKLWYSLKWRQIYLVPICLMSIMWLLLGWTGR